MQRDLFVFAGQSNMMGAAALPPKGSITAKNIFEYKHKLRRLGEKTGQFVPLSFKVGEFSYADLQAAYPNGTNENSSLSDYHSTTYFCPAMCSSPDGTVEGSHPFCDFSEKEYTPAPSLPPYFLDLWEQTGRTAAFCSMAKGATSIRNYFDPDMIIEVNRRIENMQKRTGEQLPLQADPPALSCGAAAYFREKTADFFADCESRFAGELSGVRGLIWLQGEDDSAMPPSLYKIYLSVLFDRAKKLGVTHFLCIRVGFWAKLPMVPVMLAQEQFCREIDGAYMLTRLASFLPLSGDISAYSGEIPAEYFGCRDSFFGFPNAHINEKGFRLIARPAAENLLRILKGESPVLEEERVKKLIF